jgi:hypothetical protein
MQAGALVHSLTTKTVMVEEINGAVVAKVSNFSQTAIVQQMEKVCFELVKPVSPFDIISQ